MNTMEFKSGTFGGVDLAGHTMGEAVNHLRPENAPEVQGEPVFDGAAWIWRTPCGWTMTAFADPGSDEYAIGWAAPGDGPMFSVEPDGVREFTGDWNPARELVSAA